MNQVVRAQPFSGTTWSAAAVSSAVRQRVDGAGERASEQAQVLSLRGPQGIVYVMTADLPFHPDLPESLLRVLKDAVRQMQEIASKLSDAGEHFAADMVDGTIRSVVSALSGSNNG